MAATVETTLATDAWTAVATGAVAPVVAVKGGRALLHQKATGLPAASVEVGIPISADVPVIPLPTMGSGDTLYARALEKNVSVVVIS